MAGTSAEGYRPLGHEQIVPPGALTVPAAASRMVVQAEGGDLRWRDDGTAPAAGGPGQVLKDGAAMWYEGDLEGFRAVRVGAAGVLNVAYYA